MDITDANQLPLPKE